MLAILSQFAKPIAEAFFAAFGQALAAMLANWRRDQAIADAAAAKQALAVSEVARKAEQRMADSAVQPISDADLLAKLDAGAA